MKLLQRFTPLVSLACSVLALVTLVWSETSEAVPAYARQTGMNCNSCHVGTDSVPNFTHTGRLFAMRGYIKPYVRERLRADGTEGDWGDGEGNSERYGGHYLALNWDDYFSARFISELYEDGKSASGESMPATSDTLGRMAMFYTGAITDWLGLWTEIAYLGNNSLESVHVDSVGEETGLNTFAFDEYRLSASFDIDNDSFWGVSLTNEHPSSIPQFNFPVVLPDMWYTGQGGTGSAFKRTVISPYLLKDRWWLQYGIDTGATNSEWSGNNHYGAAYYNLSNRQRNDIWIGGEGYVGNDFIAVTNAGPKASFICTDVCPEGISDAAFSFSNFAGYTPAPVADIDVREIVDDFASYKISAHQTVADKGAHSWTAGLVLHGMHQDFESGGDADRIMLGGSLRYFWNRTYGVEVFARKDMTYDYTNGAGQEFEVETPSVVWGLTGLWNPAMNFSVHVDYRPRYVYSLDPELANSLDEGYAVQVGFEYNF